MDFETLKNEITNDTLARGYSAMSNAEVANSLNLNSDRTIDRTSITGDEAFSTTDQTEFANNLTNEKRQLWLAFCGRESIDPFGASNVEFVQYIFGSGSATVSALSALRVSQASRAEELGLGLVKEGHVEYARAI